MIDEFGNETDEDTADVGGLAVYNDPNVQSSVAARTKASNDYKAYYDNMALELSKKRYGPSFSERMFQLSAAFATPTKRRGLSAVLGNVAPVLAAQAQVKREGEISRQEALDKLQGNRLAQLAALANQDVTTSIAMARLKQQGTGPGQWSEKFGRFIPKDRPVPIKVGMLNGRRIVTLTDGTSKLYGVGGNPKAYEILDAAGNVIGQETE